MRAHVLTTTRHSGNRSRDTSGRERRFLLTCRTRHGNLRLRVRVCVVCALRTSIYVPTGSLCVLTGSLCVLTRSLYVLCVYSPEVCVYSPEVCVYSPEVCLYSPEVCVYSPEVCVYSPESALEVPVPESVDERVDPDVHLPHRNKTRTSVFVLQNSKQNKNYASHTGAVRRSV